MTAEARNINELYMQIRLGLEEAQEMEKIASVLRNVASVNLQVMNGILVDAPPAAVLQLKRMIHLCNEQSVAASHFTEQVQRLWTGLLAERNIPIGGSDEPM